MLWIKLRGKVTDHGAEDIRLALSVRQLIWVNSGWCLYAPLAVKRCAYAHITVIDIRRANRSSTGSCLAWKFFKYCNKVHKKEKDEQEGRWTRCNTIYNVIFSHKQKEDLLSHTFNLKGWCVLNPITNVKYFFDKQMLFKLFLNIMGNGLKHLHYFSYRVGFVWIISQRNQLIADIGVLPGRRL